MALTSAQGYLSLLDEPSDELRLHALQQLDQSVNTFWSEIAHSIFKIESLCDDEKFSHRPLAAVVASKVFYHLEALDDALKYALRAGDLFEVEKQTEYVETLVSKCIDDYISLRVEAVEKKESKDAEYRSDEELNLNPKLSDVVNRMFARCFAHGKYKQAAGVAIDSRRLDIVKEAIEKAPNMPEMLDYCFQVAQTVVTSRTFRHSLILLLVRFYQNSASPDYISLCQCLLFLDDHASVASALDTLIQGSVSQTLSAYQVAFDLYENQQSTFLLRVVETLSEPAISDEEKKNVDKVYQAVCVRPKPVFTPQEEKKEKVSPPDNEAQPMETGPAKVDQTTIPSEPVPEVPDTYGTRMFKLKKILTGEVPTNLYLKFLSTHCNADVSILNRIKQTLTREHTMLQEALSVAQAIMFCGTTNDNWVAAWVSQSSNSLKKSWTQFTATAGIGVIHQGNHANSVKVIEPLKTDRKGAVKSPYAHGGSLYALGLIHANQGGESIAYLSKELAEATTNESEIVQHGACLGIGLAAMGTQDEKIHETLREIVFSENAVAGEGAAVACGLVLLGSGHEETTEVLFGYAHDTNHEKIIRGISMALALMNCGREELADETIDKLSSDKDPLLRYGGMYTIALAYAATSNNSAIKRLLHVAVSDVANDVRRAAVTALGFVLANNPKQVPRIVSLLSESFNPYVRYGSCMAVGIACAGTGLKSALSLLEPLMRDSVDFVRQAALIAMSMVLIQHNKTKEPRSEAFRDHLHAQVLKNERNHALTKMGAVLATGIIDAGGRNVGISLLSRAGHKRMGAIVGMAMFCQFWYWYPFTHFISLALSPSAVIGLNSNLQMPKDFSFISNAPASLYTYPAPIVIEKREKKKEIKKATLSVSKKRNKQKSAENEGEATMDQEADTKKNETTEAKEEEKKIEAPEAPTEVLRNPSRVTEAQSSGISVDDSQRFRPVKQNLAGFVMLEDMAPSDDAVIVYPYALTYSVPGISSDEPDPPASFPLPDRYK